MRKWKEVNFFGLEAFLKKNTCFNVVVEKPPFEVTETGWGEFEIQIKLFFVDPHEKPLTFSHGLKLYPLEDTPLNKQKQVVVEHYDEIVCQDPTEALYQEFMQYTKQQSFSSKKGSLISPCKYKRSEKHQDFRKEILYYLHLKLDAAMEQLKTQLTHYRDTVESKVLQERTLKAELSLLMTKKSSLLSSSSS
jgi:transcription initiation factor IIF auxiliary subunit